MAKHKVCVKCNIKKPLSCYYVQNSHKDGYSNICKECDKKKRQENRLDKTKVIDKSFYRQQLKKAGIKFRRLV